MRAWSGALQAGMLLMVLHTAALGALGELAAPADLAPALTTFLVDVRPARAPQAPCAT